MTEPVGEALPTEQVSIPQAESSSEGKSGEKSPALASSYQSEMQLWSMELNPVLKMFARSPQQRMTAVAWGKAAAGDVEGALSSSILTIIGALV